MDSDLQRRTGLERARDRNYKETVVALAGLSMFVICDLTDPSSSPLELQATVPHFMIPFVPLLEKGKRPFSMFTDLKNQYSWMLPVVEYVDREDLLARVEREIVAPAVQKQCELAGIKALD